MALSTNRHALQEAFGAVVRDRRRELHISQEELAAEAGLHRTYISLLERGERNPSLAVMAQLARALEIPLSGLVIKLEGEG